MNIAYTHRFTDPYAKTDAARQNLEHMMFLFWQDNAPEAMRNDPVWIEDTKEEISEHLDVLFRYQPLSQPTVIKISDILSNLVTASQESWKDHNAQL